MDYAEGAMLSIEEIMDNIRKETDYRREGLVAMLPFLRAYHDGACRLVVPLLERVALEKGGKATHIIIRMILYIHIATGEILAREDAAKFFQPYAQGSDLLKPVPMFRTGVDKAMAEEYRSRQIALLEKVRREVCDNGECAPDTYMEYLRYALYYTSNEFAAMLLCLSRTFATDTRMTLECVKCHKKVVKDVQDYREGQLVFLDCPHCQRMIHATYHKTGSYVTYNDRYMRQERSQFLDEPTLAVQEEVPGEDILETESVFSMCEPLKREDADLPDQTEPAGIMENCSAVSISDSKEERQEHDSTAIEPALAPIHTQEAVKDGRWQDIICQEAKVIGLAPVKRLFTVIRSISFLDHGPVPVFALFGDRGCGINTSIRCLSGYQDKEILYTDLSLIQEDCLHVLYRCIVIGLHAKGNVPIWLPAALCRLKEHTTVFFVGSRDARLPEDLAAHVTYRIVYKPYTTEDLSELFISRLSAYGLHVTLTKEQQTLLFKNKNALDVKHLCQQIYFKHKLALYDGKALSEDLISEEEIAREIKGTLNKGEQRGENERMQADLANSSRERDGS